MKGSAGDPVGDQAPTRETPADAWHRQQDHLIDQRDALRPTTVRPLFVAVPRSVEAVVSLEPIVRRLTQTGQRVAWVVGADPRSHGFEAVAAEMLSRDLNPHTPAWLRSEYEDPNGGLSVVLYGDADEHSGHPETCPTLAAEFGVRVALVPPPHEEVPFGQEDRYDKDAYRAAWRIYAADRRQAALIGVHCAAGARAVRVAGNTRIDRFVDSESTLRGKDNLRHQLAVLWHPDDRRRTTSEIEKSLVPVLRAARRCGMRVVVRPQDWSRSGEGRELSQLLSSEPLLITNEVDVVKTLEGVAGVVSGFGGPIPEALVVGRPAAYQVPERRAVVTEGAEYVLACRMVRSEDEIAEFLEHLASSDDGGATHTGHARSAALARWFTLDDGQSISRIVDDLIYSLPDRQAPGVPDCVANDEFAPLLSVAMIVKNEEENLPRCLQAISTLGDVVSEVCVYDTGSEDQSREVAAGVGARVVPGYWDDDFSRARNDAIAGCGGRWVLLPDADDRVAGDGHLVRECLRRELTLEALGAGILFVSVEDARHGTVKQIYPVPRLMRPDLAVYRGVVHEEPRRRDGRNVPVVTLPHGTLHIRTHGYEDARTVKDKVRRNLKLADADVRLQEGKGDVDALAHALVDRGRSALGLGDGDRAVADLKRVCSLPSDTRYRWWGIEILTEYLADLGRTTEAEETLAILDREGSPWSSRQWLRARLAYEQGRNEEALTILRGLSEVTNAIGSRRSPGLVCALRSQAAFALGLQEEALFAMAQMMAGEGMVAGHGAALLQAATGRTMPEVAAQLVAAGSTYLAQIAAEVEGVSDDGVELARILRRTAKLDTSLSSTDATSSFAAQGR